MLINKIMTRWKHDWTKILCKRVSQESKALVLFMHATYSSKNRSKGFLIMFLNFH